LWIDAVVTVIVAGLGLAAGNVKVAEAAVVKVLAIAAGIVVATVTNQTLLAVTVTVTVVLTFAQTNGSTAFTSNRSEISLVRLRRGRRGVDDDDAALGLSGPGRCCHYEQQEAREIRDPQHDLERWEKEETLVLSEGFRTERGLLTTPALTRDVNIL
jgi:hypothetical protein